MAIKFTGQATLKHLGTISGGAIGIGYLYFLYSSGPTTLETIAIILLLIGFVLSFNLCMLYEVLVGIRDNQKR